MQIRYSLGKKSEKPSAFWLKKKTKKVFKLEKKQNMT